MAEILGSGVFKNSLHADKIVLKFVYYIFEKKKLLLYVMLGNFRPKMIHVCKIVHNPVNKRN